VIELPRVSGSIQTIDAPSVEKIAPSETILTQVQGLAPAISATGSTESGMLGYLCLLRPARRVIH
jgi:hypothetical protein